MFIDFTIGTLKLLGRVNTTYFHIINKISLQVRHHVAVRILSVSRHPGSRPLLDRLLQFDAESTHLCVLQSRLQGGVQKHAAMRVPVLEQETGLQCVLCVEGAIKSVYRYSLNIYTEIIFEVSTQ